MGRLALRHPTLGVASLAALLSAPIESLAEVLPYGSDFAVDRFEVTGSGAFVDEFDDGQRAAPPTSSFVDQERTRVSESGGFLQIGYGDLVYLNRPLSHGAGNSTVSASFRADVPFARGGAYGLALLGLDESGAPLESSALTVFPAAGNTAGLPPACQGADGIVVVFRQQDGPVLGCSVVLPAALGSRLVLRLAVDDAAETVSPSFSLNGGATFETAGAWSVPPTPSEIYTGVSRVVPGLLAWGEVPVGYGALSSTPQETRGPGDALLGLAGELHAIDLSNGSAVETDAIGAINLAAPGSLDLRATLGTVSLSIGASTLDATGQRINEVRRVDPASGLPIALAALANATCPSVGSQDCYVPGGPIPGSVAAFDALCDLTRGFSSLDPSACALDIFSSRSQPFLGVALSDVLLFLLGGGGVVNAAFVGILSPFLLPVIQLSVDPLDITPGSGSGVGANGYLSQRLTVSQEAALGCGPAHGRACDRALGGSAGTSGPGFDLRNAEASALIQSFPGLDDQPVDTVDGTHAQPGTSGYAGAVPLGVCTRRTGGQTRVIGGCRGPTYDSSRFGGAGDFDANVDGNVSYPAGGARTGVLGYDDAAGNPLGYLTNGHPFTGQAWSSEMAALSWNLLMLLVATSTATNPQLLLDPSWMDPTAPFDPTRCSLRRPDLCTAVRSFLDYIAKERADDPSGPPALRWLWETGGDYDVTSVSGLFDELAEGTAHVFGPVATNQPSFAWETGVLLSRAASADYDEDSVFDATDNCPFFENVLQEDRGRRATSQPDGIGDACQCGDVNGDGRISVGDATLIQRSLLNPPTATLAKPGLCNVNAIAGCGVNDATTIRRALLNPPTAVIQQACPAALPQ